MYTREPDVDNFSRNYEVRSGVEKLMFTLDIRRFLVIGVGALATTSLLAGQAWGAQDGSTKQGNDPSYSTMQGGDSSSGQTYGCPVMRGGMGQMMGGGVGKRMRGGTSH